MLLNWNIQYCQAGMEGTFFCAMGEVSAYVHLNVFAMFNRKLLESTAVWYSTVQCDLSMAKTRKLYHHVHSLRMESVISPLCVPHINLEQLAV